MSGLGVKCWRTNSLKKEIPTKLSQGLFRILQQVLHPAKMTLFGALPGCAVIFGHLDISQINCIGRKTFGKERFFFS